MKSKTKQSTAFLSIVDSWQKYFVNMDEGLGSTYERFILHRFFREIKETFGIQSVLEAPSFGMTGVSGINSLWWAKEGTRPVVLDNDKQRIEKSKTVWNSIPLPVDMKYVEDFHHLPFGNKAYDMSWNFASLWFVANLESFLTELDRVTQKVIFICVPNRLGIGYGLRSLFNRRLPPDFYKQNIPAKRITELLKNRFWKVWKAGYFDIPPWPDIAMKKEDMLAKAGLGFLLKKNETAGVEQRISIVDYFNGTRPDLEKHILKYDFMEKAPFPVKQLWAHHRYFIFVKG